MEEFFLTFFPVEVVVVVVEVAVCLLFFAVTVFLDAPALQLQSYYFFDHLFGLWSLSVL